MGGDTQPRSDRSQDMIDAIAFGTASGLDDSQLLESMQGVGLMDIKSTLADLLKFKVTYLDDIRSLYRDITKVQMLSGVQKVQEKLLQRIKISEQNVEVAACNAYMRFVTSVEDGGSIQENEIGRARRLVNPHQEKLHKQNRLKSLIEKATNVATGKH